MSLQFRSAEAARTASVDRLLELRVNAAPLALTPVVITFDHQPTRADLLALKTLGIAGGVALDHLPMVLTSVNRTQLNALRTRSGVASLYANRTFKLSDDKSRPFIGLDNLRQDAEVKARNEGLPVSGRGIGVAYVDTGIDATHPDLQLGKSVVQNVFFPLAESPVGFNGGFVPPVALENQPLSDVEGGHGTFGAGITAGTGEASGGFYGGVAPGAKLVGLVAGNDYGLTEFAILQAYDYTLANRERYNIRVCNNSWGTTLADAPYNPLDPINVATRAMHDNNITVVFAAGNDGDAPDMINPYSVAPWVVSVAAGIKELYGTPTDFSSRGNDNGTGTDVAGMPADPNALPNLRPDITGSGANIKSTRSKAPGVTNGAGSAPLISNDHRTIPVGLRAYYTTSQGTSFSAPQVSGVVALMMEANPTLTPDDVVTLLRQTASPMPYSERVVGAGYVDAHNAVRAALNMAAAAHPYNLIPPAGTPEIVDPQDDHGDGTTDALDIREVNFYYDAAARQIVYRIAVGNLSQMTTNNQWTASSIFGTTTIFVSAAVTEDGQTVRYKLGQITVDPQTGVNNQTSIASGVDSGEMSGNLIIIKVSVDKINAALGQNVNVLGMTSKTTAALSQVLVGSSATGGLLLAADSAGGTDFKVEDESSTPPVEEN
ncbi:MAG TPA: S8 family serine peptidase [Pyrinomonadaceae bacterium]|nr:S8 family serine peptidase [Pyrinomonadaceae bacterium]